VGSFLVAADGIGSRVARQLTSSATFTSSSGRSYSLEPLDLGTRMVYGKTPLNSVHLASVAPELQRGMGMVVDADTTSGMESHQRPRLSLFYEVMRFDHPTSLPGHGEVGDYIYWVLSGKLSAFAPIDTPSDDSMNPAAAVNAGIDIKKALLDPSGIVGPVAAQLAIDATSHWHPTIHAVLTAQDQSRTAILRMTTSDPGTIPSWSGLEVRNQSPGQGLITLMGDAVHCMPPTGGSGANTALRDAALLGRLLRETWEARRGKNEMIWQGVVQAYDREMRTYAEEIVRTSYHAAVKAFGVDPLPEYPVDA
jgi:hypothetical protein